MLKDQPSHLINESAVDTSPPAIGIAPLRLDTLADASSSQSQSVYHGGFENIVGSRGTAFPDVNIEGLETGSHGMYDASTSLSSFGYSQMPQRSYASFMAPPYSINGHVQSYNVQELPQSGPHYHQQLFSPNIPYASSQTSLAKVPVNFELQGDGNRFVPRPDYFPKLGSLGGRSNFSGHSGGFKLLQQDLEGFESGAMWSEWPKPSNGNRPLEHFSSRAACPKQISSLGLSVNHCGMVSQQKESLQGLGSCLSPSYKHCSQGPIDRDFGYDYLSSSIFGTNGRNWSRVQEARQGARCNDFSCSCSVALDTLSERNRGPRAFKPKSQATENSSAAGNLINTVAGVCSESYNRLDFVTDYKDAKFFVIKSYSEDNVHKSIKYGVWASTPNGNKKLDAAYHEAKGKHGTCPVFLLFSVNASAQFCGVAEMVGPVDFDKSVDFWQQDKWSGQFPVKWHIIKDVPNSQFRHIVLENNDNKPVTNSRDTQEVELEQGVEMLSIFKNYENHSSILDDFHFYEERQKAMRVKKSRQQVSVVSTSVVGVREQNPVPLSNDLMKKMSKSFAEAVLLNDSEIKPSLSHLQLGMMGVEPEKHS